MNLLNERTLQLPTEVDFHNSWIEKNAADQLVLHTNKTILPNWIVKLLGIEITYNLSDIKEKLLFQIKRNITDVTASVEKKDYEKVKKDLVSTVALISKVHKIVEKVEGITPPERSQFLTTLDASPTELFENTINNMYKDLGMEKVRNISNENPEQLSDTLFSLNQKILRSIISNDLEIKKTELRKNVEGLKLASTVEINKKIDALLLGTNVEITEAQQAITKAFHELEQESSHLLLEEEDLQKKASKLREEKEKQEKENQLRSQLSAVHTEYTKDDFANAPEGSWALTFKEDQISLFVKKGNEVKEVKIALREFDSLGFNSLGFDSLESLLKKGEATLDRWLKSELAKEGLHHRLENVLINVPIEDIKQRMQASRASMKQDTPYLACTSSLRGYSLIQAMKTKEGLVFDESQISVDTNGQIKGEEKIPQAYLNFTEFEKDLNAKYSELITTAKETGVFVSGEQDPNTVFGKIKNLSKFYKGNEFFCVVYEKDHKAYASLKTPRMTLENKELLFIDDQWKISETQEKFEKLENLFEKAKPVTLNDIDVFVKVKTSEILKNIEKSGYFKNKREERSKLEDCKKYFKEDKWLITKNETNEYEIVSEKNRYQINKIISENVHEFLGFDVGSMITILLGKINTELTIEDSIYHSEQSLKERADKVKPIIENKVEADPSKYKIVNEKFHSRFKQYPYYFSDASIFSQITEQKIPGVVVHDGKLTECYVKIEGKENKITVYKSSDNSKINEFETYADFKKNYKKFEECEKNLPEILKHASTFFDKYLCEDPGKTWNQLETTKVPTSALWGVSKQDNAYVLSIIRKTKEGTTEKQEVPITYLPTTNEIVIDGGLASKDLKKIANLLAQGFSPSDADFLKNQVSETVFSLQEAQKKITKAQEEITQEKLASTIINTFLEEKKSFAATPDEAKQKLLAYQELFPEMVDGTWVITTAEDTYTVFFFKNNEIASSSIPKKEFISFFNKKDRYSSDDNEVLPWVFQRANVQLKEAHSLSSLDDAYEDYVSTINRITNALYVSENPKNDLQELSLYQEIYGEGADGCYYLFKDEHTPANQLKGVSIQDGQKKDSLLTIDREGKVRVSTNDQVYNDINELQGYLQCSINDYHNDVLEEWAGHIEGFFENKSELFGSPSDKALKQTFSLFKDLQNIWWIEPDTSLNYNDVEAMLRYRKAHPDQRIAPKQYTLCMVDRNNAKTTYPVSLDFEYEYDPENSERDDENLMIFTLPDGSESIPPHSLQKQENFLKLIKPPLDTKHTLTVSQVKENLESFQRAKEEVEKFVVPLEGNEDDIKKIFCECRDKLHLELHKPILFGRRYFGIQKGKDENYELLWQRTKEDTVSKASIDLLSHPGKFTISGCEPPVYDTIEAAIEAVTQDKVSTKKPDLFPLKNVWDAYKKSQTDILRITDPNFMKSMTMYQQAIQSFWDTVGSIGGATFFSWIAPLLPQKVQDFGSWMRDRITSQDQKMQNELFSILKEIDLPGKTKRQNIIYLSSLKKKYETEGASKFSLEEKNCFTCLCVLMDEKLSNTDKIKSEFAQILAQKITGIKGKVYQSDLRPLHRYFSTQKERFIDTIPIIQAISAHLGQEKPKKLTLEDHLQGAIELTEDDFYTYTTVADLDKKTPKMEEAKGILLGILKQNKNSALAHGLLGEIYRREKDTQKAEVHLRRAIELGSNDGFAYARLGKLSKDQKKNDDALQYLEQALRLDTKDSFACTILGDMYLEKGERQKAKEYYVKALERDSENEYVRNRLKQNPLQQIEGDAV